MGERGFQTIGRTAGTIASFRDPMATEGTREKWGFQMISGGKWGLVVKYNERTENGGETVKLGR